MYAEYGLVSVWSEVAHYTSDNVIGKDMFAYLGSLEEVKLPLTATREPRSGRLFGHCVSPCAPVPEGA